MTARSDSTPLIAGRTLSSRYGGFGIRGADAPLAGEHGPGLIGPAVSLPAENDDEFRAEIITIPGTLTYSRFFEDGTTEAEGPDGVHSGTWRLRKNNAVVGPDPQTYTFVFGPPPELSGDSALGDLVSTGGIDAPNALTGASTLDALLATGSIDAPNSLAGTAALDDLQSTGTVSSVFPSEVSGTAQLADLVCSGEIASAASFTLTGTAVLEAIVASGEIDAPNLLGGTSVLGDLSSTGDLVSAVPTVITGESALDGLLSSGTIRALVLPTEELLTAVLRTLCSRVSPDVAPLSTARPYITYQAIGGQAWRYVDLTAADNRHTMVQINVWADTRRQARDLIQSVEDALCAATTFVAWPMGEAQSDATDLGDRTVYGSLQDFEIVADR